MRAQTERLRLEYRDSTLRAKELVSSSSADALRRKPAEGGWCAAECLDHLNLTAADYMRRIREAIDHSVVRPPRREEKLSWIGRYFVRNFEPPPRRRFTTAATLVPAAVAPRIDVLLHRFEQTHLQMIRLAEETDAIDRMSIKLPVADSDWVRISVFDALCLMGAHDRRHLWQAEHAARV
ncbi:MAG TPA: DinB family protein [Thermoanaerobaculia bacterium]|nr:DinB family protein [Thermoanaerobaculia bacterium]